MPRIKGFKAGGSRNKRPTVPGHSRSSVTVEPEGGVQSRKRCFSVNRYLLSMDCAWGGGRESMPGPIPEPQGPPTEGGASWWAPPRATGPGGWEAAVGGQGLAPGNTAGPSEPQGHPLSDTLTQTSKEHPQQNEKPTSFPSRWPGVRAGSAAGRSSGVFPPASHTHRLALPLGWGRAWGCPCGPGGGRGPGTGLE